MTLQEAYYKIDESCDEYQAAGFALRQTLRGYKDAPLVQEQGHREQVTLHHLENCALNIQITYLVRLFAEFEAILRDYWLNGRGRTTTPRMADLMSSITAYCFMNQDDVQNAHEVREYRNDVVHRHEQDPRFDFQACRSRLACFIRWLPQKW
jgi:hypothetical protein